MQENNLQQQQYRRRWFIGDTTVDIHFCILQNVMNAVKLIGNASLPEGFDEDGDAQLFADVVDTFKHWFSHSAS